jgi:hypothetical protein
VAHEHNINKYKRDTVAERTRSDRGKKVTYGNLKINITSNDALPALLQISIRKC